MRTRVTTPIVVFALALLVPVACTESPTELLSPDRSAAAKGGTKGKPGGGNDGGGSDSGAVLVADLVAGDFVSAGGAAWLSAGSAETSSNGGVLYHHTRCGDVTPEGSGYALTDDVRLEVMRRGKSIEAVRFWGQDDIGDAAVAHETDWIPVSGVSKNDIRAGYTLHVHADEVAVWRLDGHLGGNRVAVIGTISIGDVAYSEGTPAVCEGGTAG